MPTYIRFANKKQVEVTILENKPAGIDWCEAPRDFDWEKSYCLTEGGEIVERSSQDIQEELLQNEKLSALDSVRCYFDNYTHQYTGHSYQKSKSYEIQEKAAENILASPETTAEKDRRIIEPLAKVREISIVEMAKLIQEKAEKATKAIAKCEELEDVAKKTIKEITNKKELQSFLSNFKEQIKSALVKLEENK